MDGTKPTAFSSGRRPNHVISIHLRATMQWLTSWGSAETYVESARRDEERDSI